MKNVYDFNGYMSCVRQAGVSIEMKPSDFFDFKNGLSQGKASKESRPLLEEVSEIQFRVADARMYFKRSFNEDSYSCTDFLVKKFKDLVSQKRFFSSQVVKTRPPLDESRKAGIVDKLCPLMPTDRKEFWLNL